MILSLVFFVFTFSHSAETLLSRTVGTAAFQVVTTREAKANELLNQALEKDLQDSFFESVKDPNQRALFEVAIFRESQNLAAVKMEAVEIRNLTEAAQSYLQKNSDWKRLDVTKEELRTWVERKKMAHEFLKLKSRSLTGIVTDQEVKDYFEANRAQMGKSTIEDQTRSIRQTLRRASQQKRIQEWLAALTTKYQIRNDLTDKKNQERSLEEQNDSQTPNK